MPVYNIIFFSGCCFGFVFAFGFCNFKVSLLYNAYFQEKATARFACVCVPVTSVIKKVMELKRNW